MFGNFSEITLPDVLPLVGRGQQACLEVWRYSSQYHYEIFIDQDHIVLLKFNGSDIVNESQAISFVADLVTASEGEFQVHLESKQNAIYNINLSKLMLQSVSMANEIIGLRIHFPEPDTVFVLTSRRKAWLDNELDQFWQSARPFLERGASARDLFNSLGLFLDQICLHYYKLRAAGMIEPQRVNDIENIAPLQTLPEESNTLDSPNNPASEQNEAGFLAEDEPAKRLKRPTRRLRRVSPARMSHDELGGLMGELRTLMKS